MSRAVHALQDSLFWLLIVYTITKKKPLFLFAKSNLGSQVNLVTITYSTSQNAAQGYAAKYLTATSPREKNKALLCNVCQFPWCEYSLCGQLQTTDMMSLKVPGLAIATQ